MQAWIDLLPGWQSDRVRRIDGVVMPVFPEMHEAIRWHGAWYGVPGRGWFLAIGSLKAYLELAFLDGDHLVPPPPVHLKTRPERALDLRESDVLDEGQLADWVRQAIELPGWGKA